MHAVLTGDIVGSSTLSPEEHRKMVGIVKSVPQVFPDAVVGAVDFFSGDSWQLLLTDSKALLLVVLYVRASLKREKDFTVDSRISIAWGGVDMKQVNLERMSESTGELFTVSGRALAGLKKNTRMCFTALDDECLTMSVGAAVELLDVLVRQWSREQARAVAESLRGRTQTEIAEELAVSQSSINKSLQAAHWTEILSAQNLIHSAMMLTLTKNHPAG
ncbi:hypothetical protein P4C99_02090 [Pontiellaceae bacterium B1224]|nr:hypothetical protein [Pontiellaceae bacterium B1224]